MCEHGFSQILTRVHFPRARVVSGKDSSFGDHQRLRCSTSHLPCGARRKYLISPVCRNFGRFAQTGTPRTTLCQHQPATAPCSVLPTVEAQKLKIISYRQPYLTFESFFGPIIITAVHLARGVPAWAGRRRRGVAGRSRAGAACGEEALVSIRA